MSIVDVLRKRVQSVNEMQHHETKVLNITPSELESLVEFLIHEGFFVSNEIKSAYFRSNLHSVIHKIRFYGLKLNLIPEPPVSRKSFTNKSMTPVKPHKPHIARAEGFWRVSACIYSGFDTRNLYRIAHDFTDKLNNKARSQ